MKRIQRLRFYVTFVTKNKSSGVINRCIQSFIWDDKIKLNTNISIIINDLSQNDKKRIKSFATD